MALEEWIRMSVSLRISWFASVSSALTLCSSCSSNCARIWCVWEIATHRTGLVHLPNQPYHSLPPCPPSFFVSPPLSLSSFCFHLLSPVLLLSLSLPPLLAPPLPLPLLPLPSVPSPLPFPLPSPSPSPLALPLLPPSFFPPHLALLVGGYSQLSCLSRFSLQLLAEV